MTNPIDRGQTQPRKSGQQSEPHQPKVFRNAKANTNPNNKAFAGFSMVETLVAVMIISASGLAAATFADLLVKMQKDTRHKSGAGLLKANITSKFFSEQAWIKTVNASANSTTLSCIRTKTDCSGVTAPVAFSLFDAEGNLLANPSLAENGFTEDGGPCSTHVTDPKMCPFRFEFAWQPVCPASGTCINPQVRITGNMVQSSVNGTNLLKGNIDKFNFDVVPVSENFARPVAKSDLFWVNYKDFIDTVASATYTLDVLKNDSDESGSALSIELISPTTSMGGTLSLNGASNLITYVPKDDFYGVDSFQYRAVNQNGSKSTGSVWLRVVTPYTWIGAVDSDGSNRANWCGKVKADLSGCNPIAANFPGTFLVHQTYLVFNENCSNCTANLNFSNANNKIGMIHLASGFSGTVNHQSNIYLTRDLIAIWGSTKFFTKVNIAYLQEAGTFNGSAAHYLKVNEYNQASGCGMTSGAVGALPYETPGIKVTGGIFNGPQLLASSEGLIVPPGVNFNPGAEVQIGAIWCHDNFISVPPTVTFNTLKLGIPNEPGVLVGGTATGFRIKSDLHTRNLIIHATGDETGVNGYQPTATAGVYNPYRIYVSEDITQSGAGGFHVSEPVTHPRMLITLDGNGVQNINGISPTVEWHDRAYLPGLEINKTGGSVKFNDVVGIAGRFYIQPTNVATLDFTGSTIDMTNTGSSMSYINVGNNPINNLDMHCGQGSELAVMQSELTVMGNFNFSPRMNNSNGLSGQPGGGTKIKVYGNFEMDGGGFDTSVAYSYPEIWMVGTGNQTITGHYNEWQTWRYGKSQESCYQVNYATVPPTYSAGCTVNAGLWGSIVIDKAGGQVNLVGGIQLAGNGRFEVVNGTVNAGTSKLISSHSSSTHVKAPGVVFYDLDFINTTYLEDDIRFSGTLTGAPVTTIRCSLSGRHRTFAQGNINLPNGFVNGSFCTDVVFEGSANQHFTIGGSPYAPTNQYSSEWLRMTVNKSSGTVNFTGSIDYSGIAPSSTYNVSNLSVQAGNLNMTNGSKLRLKTASISSGATVDLNGSILSGQTYTNSGTVNP